MHTDSQSHATVNRGYFISFDFTEDALREVRRLDRKGDLEIIPITVRELLDKSGFEIPTAA